LSAPRVWVLGFAAAACLALIIGLALTFWPARSEAPTKPPEDITGIINETADRCTAEGGKPDTSAVLRADDLNGDGNSDWIVDFAKFKCDGAANPACNPDGCMLQLYFGTGDDWDRVFQDFVQSFKFSSSGDTRTMHVTSSGIPCNKPVNQTCLYNYRLDKDAVTPVE